MATSNWRSLPLTSPNSLKMSLTCTLWLWQKRGIIAPKKVGSHNRYALSDIVRLLNNGQLGNVPVDYPSGNSGSNADDTDKEDEV